MVSSLGFVVVIRGPGVSDYHEKLAQGIADLVEANGKEITSVLYYPPAYGEFRGGFRSGRDRGRYVS